MSGAGQGPGTARPQGTGPAQSPDGPDDNAPQLGLIWAQARGGVIGADGSMPWRLPEDLAHFRRTTKGSPVVMGRRTWESFPPRFRPLPGRTNIVITRNDAFADAGAVRARDLDDALRLAREAVAVRDVAPPSPCPTIWVIGGGAVYREAIEQADLLAVTEIDLEVAGDTLAPEIPEGFRRAETDPDRGWHTGGEDLRYRIHTYRRP